MDPVSFDSLLNQVLTWWPAELTGNNDDYTNSMQSSSITIFYEREIEPITLSCGSQLLMQLDWIVYSVVDEISRRTMVIRLREIRRTFIKERFHKLIRDIAIPQLHGDKEWDGSFDRDELTNYLNHEKI